MEAKWLHKDLLDLSIRQERSESKSKCNRTYAESEK